MSGPARRVPWALVAVLAVAVLARLVPLFGRTMWYDDAVEGMMSQDVLRGRFPLFFYGQPYHGTADRYLAAPILLLLGSTPLAIALAPLGLLLTFIAAWWAATRRVFGARVALVAAVYLAVPPFYLYGWSFDARGHYHLMLIFGAFTLRLGWQIWREGMVESPRRRFVGLGLMSGLCWWTNYLGVTFLVPVGFLLLLAGVRALARGWRPLLERAGIAVASFVVGAAPLLAYHLPRGPALVPPGEPASWAQSRSQLGALVSEGLPQILGVHREVLRDAFGPAYLLVGGLILAAAAYAAVSALARRDADRATLLALLLGVAAITVALPVLTTQRADLRFPRYLLPLSLPLPVFVGLAAERLGRRARWAAAAFLLPLLVANLLGSLAMMRLLGDGQVAERERGWAARQAAQLAFLDRHGLGRVYDGLNLWTFLSDRRVLSSDPSNERMPEVAREVDASERVGWIFQHPSAPFEETLRAAGIGHRRLAGPDFVAYTDFALPSTRYVELEPEGWAASASDRPQDVALAFDRSAITAWHTGRPQQAGMYYQLDLGRVQPVGKIAWLPGDFREVPTGLGAAVSADGRAWREVVRAGEFMGPLYWSGAHPFARVRRGRVELRFAPAPARYLRLSLTAGHPHLGWSLRELLVATPAGECPGGRDPAALVQVLLARGVRFAYADHWLSARLARLSGEGIAVLPSDINLDAYGRAEPGPGTIERLRLDPDRAVVLDDCPAQAVEAAAALLRQTGASFAREEVGGFVVFRGFRAAVPPGRPARWALGAAAAPLLVTLDRPALVTRLVVECREPMPRPLADGDLAVEAAEDGQRFVETPVRVVARAKLRLSGNWLFRDAATAVVVELAPRRVIQAIRLTRRTGAPPWCAIAGVRVDEA